MAVLLVAACYEAPVAITTGSPPRVTIAARTPTAGPAATPTPPSATPTPALPTAIPLSTPTEQPTPSPTPTAAAGGPPSEGCRDGWIAPVLDDAEYQEGLTILANYMGVTGPWVLDEMRYFTGPDSPGIIEPRYDPVHRWYIKASLADSDGYRGRWLLEKRTETVLGVSAVAPYETVGYASPDWTGFVGEGPPQTYIGLPGQWAGIPYDFVTGEGDSGNAGLPVEVTDCLAGT
jgi:hypothetical protein